MSAFGLILGFLALLASGVIAGLLLQVAFDLIMGEIDL